MARGPVTMLLALAPDGLERIEATPGARARCPDCREAMLPKCGELVTHHWAHLVVGDCDPWKEHETPWHLDWKRRFPREWIEIMMGPHRADVRCPDGTVLEFQHSAIAPAEIRERETFYQRMVWIFGIARRSGRPPRARRGRVTTARLRRACDHLNVTKPSRRRRDA